MALGASAILAQTAPPAATMSGTVTNSLTGEPVLRAHVTVRCSPDDDLWDGWNNRQPYGALTNAKGEFSIGPLPPGNCSVTAERVGFVSTGNAVSSPRTDGTHREDIKLTLMPAGAITGRVLDAAGEPVLGVNVTAEGRGSSTGATSDDKGRFRLGGLRPGKYRVKATPMTMPLPPEIRSDGSPEMEDAATYDGQALSAKAAQRLEVKAGTDVSGADIRLVRAPIVIVSGKVTGMPAGAKYVNIEVQQPGEFGVSSHSGGRVKADGSFVLARLNPGKYGLVAKSWTTGQAPMQSAPLDIEVTTVNLEHLELRMIPAFDLAGQMRFDDDRARQPAQPPARPGQTPPLPQPRRMMLRQVERDSGQESVALVGSDDSFTLEKVQPGRYHVAINWGSGYVKSVRAGETESEGDVLDVRDGSGGPLVVRVSSNMCEVSGTVNDANGPVANAAVVLASDGDRSNYRFASTDASGGYKFSGLAPGKYKLVLVNEADMPSGFNEQVLEDYDDAAEKLDLGAGDKVTKNLKRNQ